MLGLTRRRTNLVSRNVSAILSFFRIHLISQNPNPSPIPVKLPAAVTENLINVAGTFRHFATVGALLRKHALNSDLNPITRKHALDGLVARLVKLRRTQYALRVRDIMARKIFGEDSSTFNPIIKWLTLMNDTLTAWRVVEVMHQSGVESNSTTYNYIVRAYLRNKCDATDELLARMRKEGMWPDGWTNHYLVVRSCRTRNLEEALGFMQRKVEEGEQVLFNTHAHIISQMLRRRSFAKAVNYVRMFCEKDKEMGARIFGFLARKLRRIGRNREAIEVVEEMVKRGLPIGKKLTDLASEGIPVQHKLTRLF